MLLVVNLRDCIENRSFLPRLVSMAEEITISRRGERLEIHMVEARGEASPLPNLRREKRHEHVC